MPLLAAWIGNLIASLVAFFATIVGRQIALKLAAITALVALTAGLIAAVQAIIDNLVVPIPSEILIGASWLWPSNGGACVAAIISAMLLRWVYDWNARVVQLKLF